MWGHNFLVCQKHRWIVSFGYPNFSLQNFCLFTVLVAGWYGVEITQSFPKLMKNFCVPLRCVQAAKCMEQKVQKCSLYAYLEASLQPKLLENCSNFHVTHETSDVPLLRFSCFGLVIAEWQELLRKIPKMDHRTFLERKCYIKCKNVVYCLENWGQVQTL